MWCLSKCCALHEHSSLFSELSVALHSFVPTMVRAIHQPSCLNSWNSPTSTITRSPHTTLSRTVLSNAPTDKFFITRVVGTIRELRSTCKDVPYSALHAEVSKVYSQCPTCQRVRQAVRKSTLPISATTCSFRKSFFKLSVEWHDDRHSTSDKRLGNKFANLPMSCVTATTFPL